MSAHTRLRCTAIAVAAGILASLGTPAFAATTPAKTTGLTAKPTSSGATLTWKAAKNAKLYKVCLLTGKTAKSCYKRSAKSSKLSVDFTGLKPTGGRDYFFKVVAYNGSARSTSALVGFDLLPVVKPAVVTGMQQAVTSSSVAITWPAARKATSYQVCLMTSGAGEACAKQSPKSATLKATFPGLAPTAGPDYYYRVYSYTDTASASSAKIRFDLPVGTVPDFKAPAYDKTSIDYVWGAATNADSYQLRLATDPDMKTGLKQFKAEGNSYDATGLLPGTTYYSQLRGLNGSVAGPLTSVKKRSTPETNSFEAVVLTYNLCGQDYCRNGEDEAYKVAVPVWSTRKPIAGKIVRDTGADIIATQESSSKDTLFGTELPEFTEVKAKSAKTLFFKTAKYTMIHSGWISLDASADEPAKKYAVWAELEDKVTKTRFIATDTHTVSGKGKAGDDRRSGEVSKLLSGIDAINPANLPVVYAGDFNSNSNNAGIKYPGGYDAPYDVMNAAGLDDSIDVSTELINSRWNSANQAINPAMQYGDHTDHIFVDPRIGVSSWEVVISAVDDKTYKTPFATDHNPVMATLKIPGKS